MLPTSHHNPHEPKSSALGPAYGVVSRYKVQSNDVLNGQLRLSVEEELSKRTIWFSERLLTENEIVETLTDNVSRSVKWTTHKPKEGWYIRLRSPAFPPGSSISLLPVEPPEVEAGSGALSLLCQTRIDLTPPPPAYPGPSSSTTRRPESIQSDHSYPPTPGAGPYAPSGKNGNAPTSSLSAASDQISSSSPSQSPPDLLSSNSSTTNLPSASVSTLSFTSTQPLMAESSPVNSPPPSAGNPPRGIPPGLGYAKEPGNAISQPRSEVTRFLVKMVPGGSSSGGAHGASKRLSFFPPGLLGTSTTFSIQNSSGSLPPVLVYHDTTPWLHIGSNSGTIELDHGVARCLGVDPSFWIAVAMAYLEFLEDRDSYLAAADG